MTNSDLKISLYTWMYRVSSHNKWSDHDHCVTLRETKADEELGRFPAILWPAGWSPAHKHRRHSVLLSSIPIPLSPREALCFRVSVQGLVQHDMISDHQKLTEAHICLSAWWARTLRGHLSAREIISVMVIADRKGFLTYKQSLEQLNSPPPSPVLSETLSLPWNRCWASNSQKRFCSLKSKPRTIGLWN